MGCVGEAHGSERSKGTETRAHLPASPTLAASRNKSNCAVSASYAQTVNIDELSHKNGVDEGGVWMWVKLTN